MEISVIGVNHLTAPVEVREQFSLPAGAALQLLRTIRQESIFEEALVLDTCNRTEVYSVGGDPDKSFPRLLARVGELKGKAPLPDASILYRHRGLPAVNHLFRVAAALDAQVIGEHEIIGQVRNAYRQASEARTAGFLIHRLMHHAFRVQARVMSETALGQGTASVAQAGVDLARRIFTSLRGKTVLVVGAGQTAELAAAALVRAGADNLIVANRTLARAEELVRSLRRRLAGPALRAPDGRGKDASSGEVSCPALQYLIPCAPERKPPVQEESPLVARAIALAEIPPLIAQVDLVISSTAAPEPVLTMASLRGRLEQPERPLLMIDLAVPRDIDPQLGDLPGVHLYNIDDLEGIVRENLSRRRREIPRAEAIVQHELARFAQWLAGREVVPTIKLLQERMEALLAEEVRRYRGKFGASDRRQLERFARSLCNKIIHDPMAFLRGASLSDADGDDLAAIDLFRKIFDLDREQEP